jgi:uncharacterized protein (DUF305 family)
MKTNNINISIIIVTLLIGGVGGYLLNNNSNYPVRPMNEVMPEVSQMPGGPMMGTDNGMGHMGMTVSSEREFIEGMIPHHQEAIDTAGEVLERGGTTPEMVELAENIIIAQKREIENMKDWYEAWYGVSYQDTDDYDPMMRDLSNLSGAEIDRTFLEDMIMHHMGAIMMARSVQPYVEHQEMEDLTKAVVDTQSKEIQQMRNILSSL